MPNNNIIFIGKCYTKLNRLTDAFQIFPWIWKCKKENNLIVNDTQNIHSKCAKHEHDALCTIHTSNEVWKVNFKVFILTAFGHYFLYYLWIEFNFFTKWTQITKLLHFTILTRKFLNAFSIQFSALTNPQLSNLLIPILHNF